MILRLIFLIIIVSGCSSQQTLKTRAIFNDDVFTVTRLISVYDGDTIRVDINGCHKLLCKNIAIRIRGIDTPEIKGKCSSEKSKAIKARDTLRKLLYKSEQIQLKNMSRGKYFRIVADVYADGLDVGQELLSQNLARKYHGKRKKSWCKNY